MKDAHIFGEKVTCAAVSLHLHIVPHIQVQCHKPHWHLHSTFGDLNYTVGCAMKMWIETIPLATMKMTIAES